MRIGQLLPGLILNVGGIALLIVAVFSGFRDGGIVALIYGGVGFVLGLIILLNKNEDRVERVLKGGKNE